TFEESVHYPFTTNSTAKDEWWSFIPETHQGFLRLGPEKRVFAVAMFHELHCISTFYGALSAQRQSATTDYHVQHCLNYLRQLFLCSADMTLEPYDFVARDYTLQRVGTSRVCRDWSVIYGEANRLHEDWIRFKRSNGTWIG
ncbi:hypothetical protein NEOLEDRAFT_1058041, partial [Neolentinus lepideus HHB14362 ss-1]